MNCTAKISNDLGWRFKCLNQVTKLVTVVTTVPHLNNKVVTRKRHLCTRHASRLVSKHRYQIKHLGKNKTVEVEDVTEQGL